MGISVIVTTVVAVTGELNPLLAVTVTAREPTLVYVCVVVETVSPLAETPSPKFHE